MPETPYSQVNLNYIRTHVDKIEKLTKLSIAANPNVRAFIEEELRGRKGAAEVYLSLADGPVSLSQMTKRSKKSKATASMVCTHLIQRGLIEKYKDPARPREALFGWTEAERLIGVAKIAKRILRG